MSDKVNLQTFELDFGKHKGVRIQNVPFGYLSWMVMHESRHWRVAEMEIKRRGSSVPKIEVSKHAIDRASLRILKVWEEHRKKDEGLFSWVADTAWEAWEAREGDGEKVVHKGVVWTFGRDGNFPCLLTVVRAKKPRPKQD